MARKTCLRRARASSNYQAMEKVSYQPQITYTPPSYDGFSYNRTTPGLSSFESFSYLDQVRNPLAGSLCSRMRELNIQLKMLVHERDDLQERFISECNESINTALGHLQHLIEHIAVVDKSLIFWYKKGAPLRLMLKTLKPIGFDRDAKTIMGKNERQIQSTAHLVAQGFDQCNSICFSTLKDVQSLQLRANSLVESGIGGALDEAEDLKRENQKEQEILQLDIDKKGDDVLRVRAEANSTERIADDLKRQKLEANKASDRSAAVSNFKHKDIYLNP
jgi:hypothetical protein